MIYYSLVVFISFNSLNQLLPIEVESSFYMHLPLSMDSVADKLLCNVNFLLSANAPSTNE